MAGRQEDAALEVAVLEVLTDTVLTACPFTPLDVAHRYVNIIERCCTSRNTFSLFFPFEPTTV